MLGRGETRVSGSGSRRVELRSQGERGRGGRAHSRRRERRRRVSRVGSSDRASAVHASGALREPMASGSGERGRGSVGLGPLASGRAEGLPKGVRRESDRPDRLARDACVSDHPSVAARASGAEEDGTVAAEPSGSGGHGSRSGGGEERRDMEHEGRAKQGCESGADFSRSGPSHGGAVGMFDLILSRLSVAGRGSRLKVVMVRRIFG